NSLFIFFFLLGGCFIYAQEDTPSQEVNDTTLVFSRKPKSPKKKEKELPITDYKIISYQRDTTYFDTTLTIYKQYKYNYLRRDIFELLRFNNIGQTYNRLGALTRVKGMYPRLGAEGKHFNYMEVEDIDYYRVPTPTTELMYKTVMEQGHILDAMITVNPSPHLKIGR